jgi:hypothetical protein
VDGRLKARVFVAAVTVAVLGVAAAQEPPSAALYNALSSAQRRLLDGWATTARTPTEREREARQQFETASDDFRVTFERATARLSALALFDPENGEVLGVALDLLDGVEPPSRQPAAGAARRSLAVTFAPGARDRLHRSREFDRLDEASDSAHVTFVHLGPPGIRIVISDRDARGTVTILDP